MYLLKKLLLGFFILLIIALTFAFFFAKIKAKQGLPDYDADIKLKNLTSKVSILRDEAGTPHIFAENEKDLYRTTGFLAAQDRMWQMDLLRRVTLGRLSEIFGADFVETDVLLRSLNYSKKSVQLLKEFPKEVIDALSAYTDGVNQYLEQYKGNLPLEFFILGYQPDKWEPIHSINLIGYMAWDLKAGWNELLLEELAAKIDSSLYAEILPYSEKHKSIVFDKDSSGLLAQNKLLQLQKINDLGLDILCGSNNWAVSGQKSTTGKPLLANDMHLKHSVPGIWMQIHQMARGTLNVSGLMLPGQPFIIVGHNDSIAWGMTNTYVDNLDFYEEKINPKNPDQYLYMNEWKDFEIHHEDIQIGKDSVAKKMYRTNHRGPVVSEIKNIQDRIVTIHWIGDEASNEMLSIFKVNRANNWSDFKDAFREFKSISQNVVYADLNGNIGLYACAGVPIRKRNAPFEVLPGWTDEYDWKGLVPFDSLPSEYNPARGYVSSANNRTADSNYPYHIGTWYTEPYRIERIREMLEAKDKLSVEDFISIQNDTKSKFAERIINKCFSKLNNVGLNEVEQQAYTLLEGWNGDMDKKLVQPTLLEFYQFFLGKVLFEDEMGEELFDKFYKNSKLFKIALYNFLEGKSSNWLDNKETPATETFEDIANLAFKETVLYLANKYGDNPEQWKWGKLHTITLKHPLAKVDVLDKIFNLNRGPFALSGANHTVSPYSYPLLQPSEVHHGASHRHIFSLNSWDSTLSVIPTGNSGVVTSEFYCNQSKSFISGEYFPEPFSVEAIVKHSKYSIVAIPQK